jgi:hypothetical protein
VDRAMRDLLREIAEPLELGRMAETHFLLGHTWAQHFNKKRAQDGGPVTVRKLRLWMDDPKPRGLPEEVQNLVIMTWAEQQQLAFVLHGGPHTPSLDSMRDELELQAQRLPERDHWTVAVKRAQDIFGLVTSELLNASNVNRLISDLREKAQARGGAHRLVERVASAQREFGVDPAGTRRHRTAKAVEALLDGISAADNETAIEALATSLVQTSEAAMAVSLSRAKDLVTALDSAPWELFDAVGRLADDRAAAGQDIQTRVAETLEADELAVPLASALKAIASDAVRLLSAAPPAQPPPSPPVSAPPGGWRKVASGERVSASEAIAQIRDVAEARNKKRVVVSWTAEEKE